MAGGTDISMCPNSNKSNSSLIFVKQPLVIQYSDEKSTTIEEKNLSERKNKVAQHLDKMKMNKMYEINYNKYKEKKLLKKFDSKCYNRSHLKLPAPYKIRISQTNLDDFVTNKESFTRNSRNTCYTNKYQDPDAKSYNTQKFSRSIYNVQWKIYRCQLNTQEESCCCSCNSDAMFEVMKSLYDCYKKKNCDHCNCILCGHLPREERRQGEIRKSVKKVKRIKDEELAKSLEGKTQEQKEKLLKSIALSGTPLPEGKTKSVKELIKKVQTELGLPQAPKTASEREKLKRAEEAGLITPLEGKTMAQKEMILKKQRDLDIPLPEGRTPSEKSLIRRVKTARPSRRRIPSEKIRKAKEEGLLTPLEGKSQAQKDKILRGLAMKGIPLPEAKTISEQQLIDKIRQDVGLPPLPKTASAKEKYDKALDAGLITPLQDKSTSQKEDILRGLAELGLPLPEGRTSSEKALVNAIRGTVKPISEVKIPSAKLRKAKAAGLLTPLEGKTPAQKEEIIKGLAMHGMPLPEAKTPSENRIMDNVRKEFGLPPEPQTHANKERYNKAMAAGLITPLQGKTALQKEEILRGQAELGLPLPEGRTPSEKALISKIKASVRPISEIKVPSEKLRTAKAAGILSPLEGKTPARKTEILKGLAMHGIPLPEGKTASEKKLIEKVRQEVGLPPEPQTRSAKEKYNKAMRAGIITPLQGKPNSQKEKILKAQADAGLPLPEGRTASEKKLISKVKASARLPSVGISPSQKEKKNREQAAIGLELPEGRTTSEKILMKKIKATTKKSPSLEEIRKIDEKTAKIVKEGKGPSDECICGLLSPKEKPLSKVLQDKVPSQKLKAAKAAGLLTPLAGKSPEQKEEIIKGLMKHGIPLPESKTYSEKKLIDKVRAKIGLPPEPKTASLKDKYEKAYAAGIITPLEGKPSEEKEKILKNWQAAGLPLPKGITPSEKALIKKVKMETGYTTPTEKVKPEKERLRRAKAAGVLTPLEGKTPQQKEAILKGLVKAGVPLPEPKTVSEKDLIRKVRMETGLPPEPKTLSIREKMNKAQLAGIITPLEGKTVPQKEKVLKRMYDAGIPLPEGRSKSEKSIVRRVKAGLVAVPKIPSERLKAAKAAGLLTPLAGKSASQKEIILKGLAKHGLPLPEPKTRSDVAIMNKVKGELGVLSIRKSPSEKLKQAKAAGLLTPLKGKTKEQKENILKSLAKAGVPLPEPKSTSEKDLVSKVRKEMGLPPEPQTQSLRDKMKEAHLAGIITPLEGKTPAQKERILKRLHDHGIPLPESRTASEKSIVRRVTAGLVPEHKIPSEKLKAAKAAGLLTPLQGKSLSQKEKIIRGLAAHGLPLPEGKSSSDKAIIKKVQAEMGLTTVARKSPSEKLKQVKAAGLLTPLQGKTREQKKKILKGLVKAGVPLPDPKTSSERELINKVRLESGLPPEPKTSSLREKMVKAHAAGIITPLEGKTPTQKARILKRMQDAGIPLPEGRTTSEKSIIKRVKAEMISPAASKIPSDKIRAAEAAGLLTPLEGKTAAQKEKILKGLAKSGMPLPEGKTKSDKDLIKKVKTELGLPPEPKTSSVKERLLKAHVAGKISPLEGKTKSQKEKILKTLTEARVPLPEGRTRSEQMLIKKVQADATKQSEKIAKLEKQTAKTMKEGKGPSDECICDVLSPLSGAVALEPKKITSGKLRQAKEAGLLTPLAGKTSAQKEKIIRGLAMKGLPLPEGKTASENKLIDKVRQDIGLPPEPRSPSAKAKYDKAHALGIITPLEGKTLSQKEKILKAQADMGIILPEGRKSSEKALIAKIRTMPPKIPSEKLRKAKAAGLLTPLEGKSKKQKEKILKGLAAHGLPLPEGKSASEKNIIDKVRAAVGLPPEPKTPSAREKYNKAMAAGFITPLQGKSDSQKLNILKGQADIGLSLPEGRTASEKALIDKVKAPMRSSIEIRVPSEKIRAVKAAGLLTPLNGKSAKQKEKILKGLTMHGIPLPEAKTESDQKLIDKVRTSMGLPPEPKTSSAKRRYNKALAAGLITPLNGKSPSEKEKILRRQAELGLALPEGRSASEKALIENVKATSIPPSVTSVPSEKIRKAEAAGLLTPLEGKTAKDKEKILRGLAEAGLSLPKGKTPSEKSLVRKLNTEYGIPPKPKTVSEKQILREAKLKGILTPLKGKTAAQKEKILKGLAKAGLPMPEGTTPSEKALVRKVRQAAGLTLEPTPSEKRGKIRKISRKIGEKSGIKEEYQDVIKSTTCDRGCGCDKKKIRFKHSYVKIRVTSPDISSLCPCPEECVPGVRGGVFTDNEGIKVTVGRVMTNPSFSSKESTCKKVMCLFCNDFFDDDIPAINYIRSEGAIVHTTVKTTNVNSDTCINFVTSFTDTEHISVVNNSKFSFVLSDSKLNYSNINVINSPCLLKHTDETYEKEVKGVIDTDKADSVIHGENAHELNDRTSSFETSSESIFLLHTETSLSLSTADLQSVSVISFYTSDTNSYATSMSINNINDIDHYINKALDYYEHFEEDCFTHNVSEGSNAVVPPPLGSYTGTLIPVDISNYQDSTYSTYTTKLNDIIILRLSQQNNETLAQDDSNGCIKDPIYVVNDLDNEEEIMNIIAEILSQEVTKKSSSLIVLVPTAIDSDYDYLTNESYSSTICIQLSGNVPNKGRTDYNSQVNISFPYRRLLKIPRGIKICTKRESYISQTLIENHTDQAGIEFENKNTTLMRKLDSDFTINRVCSVDTTLDRPCCCITNHDIIENISTAAPYGCVANVRSELISPMIAKEAIAQGYTTDETCLTIPGKLSSVLNNTFNFNKHAEESKETSISLCNITSNKIRKSNGRGGCLTPKNIKYSSNKSCDCTPEKLRELFQKARKEMMSKVIPAENRELCKKKSSEINKRKNNHKMPHVTSPGASCSTCKHPNTIENKTHLQKSKGKKVTVKSSCPCEDIWPSSMYLSKEPTKKSVACQCRLCEELSAKPSSSCICKDKQVGLDNAKIHKDVTCECPQGPFEEYSDDFEWINQQYIRKMKSDLTQTSSGFKFEIPRKLAIDTEMSFEDALKYFEEHSENNDLNKDDSCNCKNGQRSSKKKNIDCECPYEIELLGPVPKAEEPFTGIKFHIDGKGSASKGLNGIVCFELLYQNAIELKPSI